MANETFEAEPYSVKNIFSGNDDPIYNIPVYQRRYAWTTDEITVLWNDLVSAFRNNQENNSQDENYFLGSIIVIPQKENKRIRDVIDGQQRITTLIILFNVIYKLIGKDLNASVDTSKSPITHDILHRTIYDNYNEGKLKLSTQSQDNIEFRKYVYEISRSDLMEITKPREKDIKNSVISRFHNALYIFKNEVLEMDNKIGDFVNYLFNNVKIILIKCNTTSFAIKLFQVLNSRGLDLTHADLIKSYLLSWLDQADFEVFNLKWSAIEKKAEESDINMSLTNYFVLYEYYLLAKNPENDLSTELEKIFKDKIKSPYDALLIIKDFEDFVNEYDKNIFFNNITDEYIWSLNYTPYGMHWRAILLTAVHVRYEEYKELKKIIRRYYYLNWIAGKNINSLKQPTFDILLKVKDKRPISEIIERMNKQLSPLTKVGEKIVGKQIETIVLEKLTGDVFYENWFRPLLAVIEYKRTRKISYIPMDKKLHVEHILPESYKTNEEWSHIDEKTAFEYLFKAGNLTLLDDSQNPEAYNWGIKKKISIYKGKGKFDDKDTPPSQFEITRIIADDFIEKKGKFFNTDNPVWNETAIKKRFNWFCDEVKTALDIDTSSIKISDFKN